MEKVGGSRNDRKKWLHLQEDIDSVIYCVNLASYFEKCFEDDLTNRIEESLNVFKSTLHVSKYKRFYIVISNVNNFNEYLSRFPVNRYFPDFTGSTYRHAVDFFISKYRSIALQSNVEQQIEREFIFIVTNTHDTDAVEKLYNDIFEYELTGVKSCTFFVTNLKTQVLYSEYLVEVPLQQWFNGIALFAGFKKMSPADTIIQFIVDE